MDTTAESPCPWQTIRNDVFTARASPAVCAISPDQILICGGWNGYDFFTDVLVFEVETANIRKIADLPFPIKCENQSYAEREGVALSLVDTKDKGECLVRFTVETNKLELVAERLQ